MKDELRRLEGIGVIKKITETTDWEQLWRRRTTRSLRTTRSTRCIDPYELNTALKGEHYVLPILDDILHKFKESRMFSKVYLKNGYWQIELDKKSSKLITFQANDHLYRWTRLPFGLKTSSEIFQKKLNDILYDLKGKYCIADDIIKHGRNQKEHDRNREI